MQGCFGTSYEVLRACKIDCAYEVQEKLMRKEGQRNAASVGIYFSGGRFGLVFMSVFMSIFMFILTIKKRTVIIFETQRPREDKREGKTNKSEKQAHGTNETNNHTRPPAST